MSESVIYPTKVDRWLVGLLGLVVSVPLGFSLWFLYRNQPQAEMAVLAAGFLSATITTVVLAFGVPTRYILHEKELEIRAGVIRWNIPYASIQEAHYSSNLLSGAAWSVQRIHIIYRNAGAHAFVLISPLNREDFMAELQKRAPQMK